MKFQIARVALLIGGTVSIMAAGYLTAVSDAARAGGKFLEGVLDADASNKEITQ